jgi:Flp pilus assembly protein TadG
MRKPRFNTANLHRRLSRDRREGVAAVEFAFVAPVFVVIVFGLAQMARMFETEYLLTSAAREGARLAGMDREGIVEGSTNDKIVQDITNFLEASGVDAEDLDIAIVSHDDPETTFDLDDPDNNLELFEIRLTLPYTEHSLGLDEFNLDAKVVFRNGKAAVAE